MAQDGPSSELLAELWTLVETWSSGAIERARSAGRDGDPDVVEAQIRSLMDHAMELRSVLDRHDPAGVAPPASAWGADDEPGLSIFEPRGVQAEETQAPETQAPETQAEPELPTVPDHRCNSADFERPPCVECGVRHWYCSVCGAVRDECAAELIS